ncbi:hypothetical protein V0R50_06945 [Pseudomonas sp. 148P]|uniref:TerB family tellurite resistance protein n=1 Tax=Pseudomonas ulcerans TaxID=3115852 RepID=A0ABU7HN79_9PSED|nr:MULTISPECIES: hypothetical protein [unclassified Pseudomonas]MEE1922477.1 hypothetical protein [Pseudomonas sp. 147P]MEE1932951.1 hypothetical protein [Pseudomonas sp. 148P]
MLMKLLSSSDKQHLIDLAKLLAIADKPLRWDGKTRDQLTSSSDLDALTIVTGDAERELIDELVQSTGNASSFNTFFSSTWHVETRLIEVLKKLPMIAAEKPEYRVQAATSVLRELLKATRFELPSTPKVVLFELFLVALRDGNISSVEWALLKEFQLHHKLEDFIFDDLLERAETMNQEVSKTISLILE